MFVIIKTKIRVFKNKDMLHQQQQLGIICRNGICMEGEDILFF